MYLQFFVLRLREILVDIKCCLFSRRENKNLPDILFGSNTLKMCDSLSILGVSVASVLSWNEHISSVAKSIVKKICFLFRSRRYFTLCSYSLSTNPKSAPVSNTARIFGEGPPSILLPP